MSFNLESCLRTTSGVSATKFKMKSTKFHIDEETFWKKATLFQKQKFKIKQDFKTKTTKVHIDEETFRKRDTLIEKHDSGIWACNVCSFTSSSKRVLFSIFDFISKRGSSKSALFVIKTG